MRAAAIWRAFAVSALVLSPVAALAGPPADPVIGPWRATEGPDVASRLELTADGRFRYMLSAGALDEGAEGRWTREGARVRLFTEPSPRAPRILVDTMAPAGGGPLTIFVRAPNGQGVAGVEFRVEYDTGAPTESYTQYDGWSGDPGDQRAPRWIQLTEPIHDIRSERFPIPSGARTLRFRLEPNDIGVMDFRGADIALEGDQLTLRDTRGELHFVRAAR